jgi:uncharacterized membrane protein
MKAQLLTQNLFAIAFVAVLAYVMPRLTRPDLYFAVTVAPDFRNTPEARAILRRYQTEVVFYSLGAFGLLLLGEWRGWISATALAVLAQVGGDFVAYYRARKDVQPHAAEPTAIREASLKPRARHLPGGWSLQLGPFALLAAAALYLRAHWTDVPERFPVHWGFDGRPDAWASRGALAVYGSLLTGAVVCAGLGLLAYATLRWSRQVRAARPLADAERHFRTTTIALVLGAEYLVALILGCVGLLPLVSQTRVAREFSLFSALTLVFAVAATAVLARAGQGGTRLPGAWAAGLGSEGVRPVGDRTAAECWKAGIIYVNRNDPARIVEKRFGIGYTMNFGHPESWVVLALILLLPLVLGLLLQGQR